MRKIITITFVTLDGVMQAPGGLEEDTSSGFKYGGWQAEYGDELQNKIINEYMGIPFELLLGRRTYDIFAPYWSNTKDDQEVAKPFNNTRKYVVSNSPKDLVWHNSTLITGDVVAEIKKLKEKDDPDLWVYGSGNLIQTLLKNHLIDTMNLWIYPVTAGSGKRLFAEGTQAEGFKLVDSKVSNKGVIIATYVPDGPLKTGSMAKK